MTKFEELKSHRSVRHTRIIRDRGLVEDYEANIFLMQLPVYELISEEIAKKDSLVTNREENTRSHPEHGRKDS